MPDFYWNVYLQSFLNFLADAKPLVPENTASNAFVIEISHTCWALQWGGMLLTTFIWLTLPVYWWIWIGATRICRSTTVHPWILPFVGAVPLSPVNTSNNFIVANKPCSWRAFHRNSRSLSFAIEVFGSIVGIWVGLSYWAIIAPSWSISDIQSRCSS